ncbi:MAG: TIM-barrel domain-containing protein [Phycisphaeraceae bacterium]
MLLSSLPGRVFGVSGQAWMMQFSYDEAMRFYGMGEKSLGFELSNKHTKFWNTDVWADFDGNVFVHGSPDPMYLSVPYMVIKQGNRYAGVLVNNPDAVFMSTNPRVRIAEQADADEATESDTRFFIGSPDGRPEVYFIVGPTLADLTRKLQRLVGVTPLPPIWALGHHQCRWGYASHADLDALDRRFKRHAIPNDGLWLDIDYMRGYRVFTWENSHWPKPEKQVHDIQSRRRRVVPILDPGVKRDAQFPVYQSGLDADVFCKNPAGTDFVGFVWPGTTVFPDFSLKEARAWWSEHVQAMVGETGITGVWLDMNDPATGLSENSEMLFDRGHLPHATYHNQYALGMMRATHDGLRAAHPDIRPFILTRSGFISTSRYAAAWTGDNFSNAHHLKQAIPMTLNLALSGIPFNGPDVPGFGGDPTRALAVAWYKAGFLFPFFRNHSNKMQIEQEPWAFGDPTMRILRRYIRLRYKLLPYLYNLYVAQAESGEAIARPLFYDFDDRNDFPLDRVDDQIMIGPSVMQAPVLDPDSRERRVLLPRARWYDAMRGGWVKGGKHVRVKTTASQTPLYVRDGAIIPMRVGEATDNQTDLRDIELHLFLSPTFKGDAVYTYHADDGESFGYQRGERTTARLLVRREAESVVVEVDQLATGYGPLRVRFVLYSKEQSLTLSQAGKARSVKLSPASWSFTGNKLTIHKSRVVTLSL